MTGLKAVLLAAGASRRFGGPKLIAPLGDRPLLAYALEIALEAPVDEVALVTGFHAEAVEAAARAAVPDAVASGRLRLVRAPHAADGMGASLAAGAAALLPASGLFVFLADMPRVSIEVVRRMALRFADDPPADAIAPVWRGRRGHPVLFGPSLFPGLVKLSGDEGARGLLMTAGCRLATTPSPDDGVIADIDTPEAIATG